MLSCSRWVSDVKLGTTLTGNGIGDEEIATLTVERCTKDDVHVQFSYRTIAYYQHLLEHRGSTVHYRITVKNVTRREEISFKYSSAFCPRINLIIPVEKIPGGQSDNFDIEVVAYKGSLENRIAKASLTNYDKIIRNKEPLIADSPGKIFGGTRNHPHHSSLAFSQCWFVGRLIFCMSPHS